MKTLFIITCVVIISLFTSCAEDTKKFNTQTSDTTSLNIPEELKQLNAQLLADPNNAELYHKRAKYFSDEKNFAAGLEDMARAISIDSTKAGYFLTLSDLYFITNKTGNAKNALEKAVQLDNKNVDAILKLAELYLYVTKNEKSMEYINMALKLNQYNAKAYFMKGMNYKDLKDTTRAISSMQTAVEQDQQYYHAYIQLGILCASQRTPLAIQYYKNAIRIQPASAEAWYNLGKYYQDIEDWRNALGTYTTLLKIDAGHKYAHYNMGVIYLIGLKKPGFAIDHFNDAIKTDPKYVEAYYGRGIAYEAAGETKTAILDFQACVDIDPQYKEAQNKLQQLNKGK